MISKVIVAGKPSSGKSTLIELLVKILSKKNIKSIVLDDYLVLRELCPKDLASNKYCYENNKLILIDEYRDEIMGNLYNELKKRWNVQFDGVTILEISNPKLKDILDRYFLTDTVPDNTAFLLVYSSLFNVKNRNELRDKWRQIPNVFIDMFDDDDEQMFVDIQNKFGLSKFLDNNENLNSYILEIKKIFKIF